MKPFAYTVPRSVENALAAIGGDRSAAYLAGGIDLLGELKDEIAAPKTVVSLAKVLPTLGGIEPGAEHWTIGAGTTIAALAAHPGLRATFPGLAEAADEVGSPQIRHAATLGGNLAQHSRCWYYRHPDVPCLKKGGSTCFALEGRNKFHSLFSGNPCISPLVANLAVALAALGGVAVVQSGEKTVRLTMAELYVDAWRNPLAHHSLEPGDLLLAVEIPVARTASAYLQVSEKTDFDWALVSCATSGVKRGRDVVDARVVLGCVAPVPWRTDAVDRLLAGQSLNAALAERAADLLLADAKPRTENAYKVPIAKTLVKRALLKLLA